MGVINVFSVVCMVYFRINNVINTQMCININSANICCSGYQWNDEQNKCIPCDKGYNGVHCKDRCAAPFYGSDCQFECKCVKEDCHYAEGCKQTNKTGNIEMIDEKDNLTCASKDTTPMIVGIIVLAAVAFIISLTILFTYQIEKHQRSRNYRERNV